jgi:hypothetical protein
MAKKMDQQELRALVATYVDRVNVDVLTGWEAGIQGKERIGRKLFDRVPPEYYEGQRRHDWYAGHRAATLHRELRLVRSVSFLGNTPDGESVRIERKGWGVRRGEIVTRMERMGCRGDVSVFYREGGNIVRTVNCGI